VVRADAEERGVPERHLACVTDGQIEAHRRHQVHAEKRHQVDAVALEEIGQHGDGDETDRERAQCLRLIAALPGS
jgi:hypothetical protein